MRVNDEQFIKDLTEIMDNYRNDKVDYPWDAKSTAEKANTSVLEAYLNTIAVINALPKYASTYRDVELSEWMIPSIFTPLIMPSEVTVDGSAEAVNLIDTTSEHPVSDEENPIHVLSFTRFMSINHALRRIFRKDESSWFHKVSDLRNPILLSDAVKRASHDGYTPHYLCMPLSLQIKFYAKDCYVYSENDVAKRFMQEHISKEV